MIKLKDGMKVKCSTDLDALIFLEECNIQGFIWKGFTEWKDGVYYELKNNLVYIFNINEDVKKELLLFKCETKVSYTLEDDEYFLVDHRRRENVLNNQIREIKIKNPKSHGRYEYEYKYIYIEYVSLTKMNPRSICSTFSIPKIYEDLNNMFFNVPPHALFDEYEDVDKVIVNKPCVIVFLKSGEKGVSKCLDEDGFDDYIGYKIALAKAKIRYYKNIIKKY